MVKSKLLCFLSSHKIPQLCYRLNITSINLVLFHKVFKSPAIFFIDWCWACCVCWLLFNPCLWIQQVLHAGKEKEIAGDFGLYARTLAFSGNWKQVIVNRYSPSIRVFGTAIVAHDEVCNAHFQLTLAVPPPYKHSPAVWLHSLVFIWDDLMRDDLS